MGREINQRKAAIIGCGFVGSATAFTLMQSQLFSELVLVDVDFDKADGEAKDIAHGIPFAGQMKIHAGVYEDLSDAAIIIVTAGAGQKPGETRLDLVHKNVAIYESIIPRIAEQNKDAILLIVSNPVDILTYTALKLSGYPENRVLGSGTVLDTARLKYALGEHLSASADRSAPHRDSEPGQRPPLSAPRGTSPLRRPYPHSPRHKPNTRYFPRMRSGSSKCRTGSFRRPARCVGNGRRRLLPLCR